MWCSATKDAGGGLNKGVRTNTRPVGEVYGVVKMELTIMWRRE